MSCRTIGILLVSVGLGLVTIIAGIGINHGTDHAQFLSAFYLETSEDSSVLGNSNLALEINLGINEVLVILVGSIVDIYKLASDISTGRVAVKGGNSVLER